MRMSDWSSDVCSSDLDAGRLRIGVGPDNLRLLVALRADGGGFQPSGRPHPLERAVERRPGGKIGALDADVDHLRTIAPRGLVHRRLNLVHQHAAFRAEQRGERSEEHTSELQSLMRTSYAV